MEQDSLLQGSGSCLVCSLYVSSSDAGPSGILALVEADHWVCQPKGLLGVAHLQDKFSCSLCTLWGPPGKSYQTILRLLPPVLGL